MEQLYSVRKKSGRYIVWCDDCWYETSDCPHPFFTKEQAEKIVKQMRNHYCYDAYIEDENGNPVIKQAAPILKEIKKAFFRKF